MSMFQVKTKFKKHKSILSLGGRSLFPSVAKQRNRLEERKNACSRLINLAGISLVIERGVYKTGIDTELMIDVLRKEKKKKKAFLEVGCGCGAVSIFLAKNGISGLAVDINELAVNNTYENCALNQVSNLSVKQSNVFGNVVGDFDLIICNPPYNMHEVEDDIDRMFWDPANSMKHTFFKQVKNYLRENGKVYFGWADFFDLELEFPIRLANENGFQLMNTYSRPSTCSSFRFLVFEFTLLNI
jgi:release factor glutamine methyltransferase